MKRGLLISSPSAGNPTAMADAKDTVYSAIIGLALALLSWIIISTINPELLFTTEPTMPAANLPPVSIGGNVPRSCAYDSLSGTPGPEPEEFCYCIGDTDIPGDTTCEALKSDYASWCNGKLNCEAPLTADDVGCECGAIIIGAGDVGRYCCASADSLFDNEVDCLFAFTEWIDGGTCDGICRTEVCDTNPECCVKADLRVGTIPTDVRYKKITVKKDQAVFVDIVTYSYDCRGKDIIRVGVDFERSWWDAIAIDYACNIKLALACGIVGLIPWPGECGKFEWSFSNEGVYYPIALVANEDCDDGEDKSVIITVEE